MFIIKEGKKILFGINFIFLIIFIFFSLFGKASEKDTILSTVYSKPFFYNVLKDKNGSIYVGTSEGVFEIKGTQLKRFHKNEGYITLDKAGDPIVNPDGIKNYNERKYLYLLPFPDQAREEYHTGTDDYFYICSGGRIYIYEIVPYRYSFANHSIRTISENFLGSYSGIYLKGKRLNKPIPSFTDGYIREIEGSAFICYDGLLMIDPEGVQSGWVDSAGRNIRSIYSPNLVQFRDVIKTKYNGRYYLSSLTELLQMDKKEDNPVSIYKSAQTNGEIVIIGEYKAALYFSDGNYVLKFRLDNEKLDTLTKISSQVMDGSVTDRNLYLLTNEGLYVMNSDNVVEKLTSLSKAHTLEIISATELVIATDNGLFSFNTVNKSLTTLISGVEFNRKAMFKNGNILQVGSINGLYTININDLDVLARKNKSENTEAQVPGFVIIGLLLAIGLVGFLGTLSLRYRKKLAVANVQIKELNVETLDREKIEDFIKENLSTASLKSITDHFNTNNSHIYKLIEPEKPGSIIQKMRMDKVIELKNSGKDINEISDATGLSVSYLKKIRNKVESEA
jgi:hypothetical protein